MKNKALYFSLVVLGWIAFGVGQFTDDVVPRVMLLALARVLP